MAKQGTKRGKTKSPKASRGDLTPRPTGARQVRGGAKGVINTKAITLPPPVYPPIA